MAIGVREATVTKQGIKFFAPKNTSEVIQGTLEGAPLDSGNTRLPGSGGLTNEPDPRGEGALVTTRRARPPVEVESAKITQH